MKNKLDSKMLKTTIEVQRASLLEGMNSSEASELFVSVADLYEEINEFEESAPPEAINSLTPHLSKVKETLEMIMQNPMNYVSKPVNPRTKKVVKLVPASNDD